MRTLEIQSLVNRRRQRRSARTAGMRRGLLRAGQGALAGLILLFAVTAVAAAVGYSQLTADLPSLAQLPEFFDPTSGSIFQPTRLYDRSGERLLLTLENPGIVRRYLHVDPAAADHFSPELLRAAVAVIEPGFWNSPGFSTTRLFDSQPSTIAERLVYDLFLTQEPADARRALRMKLLAAQAVSSYGRTQVLEWYLNGASFGHLAYGAEAAARLYLDKSAAELNLAEATLLAPLLNAPALNPLDTPNAALENQRVALERMRQNGAISQAEFDAASEAQVRLQTEAASPQSLAPAFTDLALKQISQRLGRQTLERGGLTIRTSLDYDTQLELTCLVRTQLRRLEGAGGQESLPDGSDCQSARLLPTLSQAPSLANLAASGVLLDPQTGEVLALLGDTTLEASAASLASHSPGSLLTPLAAAAAFTRGFSPASLLWDLPVNSESSADPGEARGDTADGADEEGELLVNPDGQAHGPLRLRTALANDYLVPLGGVIDQIGAQTTWRLASALGLPALADENSAGVLVSGGDSTVTELAQAYAVFANLGSANGQRLPGSPGIQPVTVLSVEDVNGRSVWQMGDPETQPVLSQALVYLVHSILSDEQARWPSLGYPNPLEVGRPAGAKAGVANSGREVWAAGYLPQRVAVFWLGQAGEGEDTLDPRYAAGMWHAMVQYAAAGLPAEDWPVPAGVATVQVCDPSGQLPTAACPNRVSEVFLSGSEPVSVDTLYQAIQVNRETGRLATVFTPPGLIEENIYLVVPPEARTWAEQSGIAAPPDVYDTIQPPAPSPYAQISSPASFVYVRGVVRVMGTAGGSGFDYYRVQAGAGLNPQTWLQVGPDHATPVEDGQLAQWDTTGLDGLYALRLLVVRRDQTVESATIQVTVDNTPPQARLLYPLPGQAVTPTGSGTVTFQAEAGDAAGVQRVEWLVDGRVAGQSLVEPYSFPWRASPGKHTASLRVTDLAGNVTETATVDFVVSD